MTLAVDGFLKHATGSTTLVLSHLSLLVGQSYDRFRARIPSLSLGILQGQTTPSPMNDVVFSTMQTSRLPEHAQRLKNILIKPVKLIVVDEAHHYPAMSYQVIRDYFPEAKVLGFTATPYKSRQVMTSCFDEIAYSISLQELIDMGMLVPPVLNQIKRETKDVEGLVASVVRLHLEKNPGAKGIVYLRTIDEAKLCRNAFDSAGILSRAVTSELTGGPRDEVLESFVKGPTEILTTVDVLTAGFDAPPVQAIYMPHGTKSPTQYLQRIGRGLRTYPGKTACQVYLYGSAPSIKKGLYEQQHHDILNAGASKKKAFDRVSEEMAYKLFDGSSEVYVWNQQVLDVIAKMNLLGMRELADMLDRRKFPKRFLQDIRVLLDRLPNAKQLLSNGKAKATPSQKEMLFRAGFGSDQVERLSRYEASMMISTITGKDRSKPVPQEYVVLDGRFAGKAVWELPHAYRTRVKKEHPDSPVARQIIAYEKRNQS